MMLSGNYHPGLIEAGVDEAGRGCLAGPVFAAAVILQESFADERLNDSKKLTEKQRDVLRIIIENEAVSWAVAVADQLEIDQINILNASHLAMHRAIEALKIRPQFLLIDGNRFKPYPEIDHICVVKGDATYRSIAAASVLAKTHRDDFMRSAAKEYPEYGWEQNKGYPTEAHRLAIMKFGMTLFHRRSFSIQHKLF
jgi:ribonuclease HII